MSVSNENGWRILHTMLRVSDLDRSVAFYVEALGMRLLRQDRYPGGRFTLAFLGYGDEASTAVLELTHNWDEQRYEPGTGYGHLAIAVPDLATAFATITSAGGTPVRPPGPMAFAPEVTGDRELIAFVADPDGYRIELIEQPGRPARSPRQQP